MKNAVFYLSTLIIILSSSLGIFSFFTNNIYADLTKIGSIIIFILIAIDAVLLIAEYKIKECEHESK